MVVSPGLEPEIITQVAENNKTRQSARGAGGTIFAGAD